MFIGLEVYPTHSTRTNNFWVPEVEPIKWDFLTNGARFIGGSVPESILVSFKALEIEPDRYCEISIYNLTKGYPDLETMCTTSGLNPNSVSLSSEGRYICLTYENNILVYYRSKKNQYRLRTLGCKVFEYSSEDIGKVEISNDGEVLIVDLVLQQQLKLINLRTNEEINIAMPYGHYCISIYGNITISVNPRQYLERAPSEGFIIDMTSSQHGSTLWDRCKALSQKKALFPIHQPIPLSVQGLYLGHVNGEFALTKVYTSMASSSCDSNTENVSNMSSTVRLTNLKINDYNVLIWTLSPDTTRMAIAYSCCDQPIWIALINLEPAVLKTFRFDPGQPTSSTLQFRNIYNDQVQYIHSMQFLDNDRLLVGALDNIVVYQLGPAIKSCSYHISKSEDSLISCCDCSMEGLR